MSELTLTEFLLARIAEDEAVAQGAGSGRWKHDGSWYLEGVEHEVVGPDEVAFTHPGYVAHIARHDPARVLVDCEAKRRIVELHQGWENTTEVFAPDYWQAPMDAVLCALALPYADHPDFRREWRP